MPEEFRIAGMILVLIFAVWLIYKNTRPKTDNGDRPLLNRGETVPNNKIVLVSNVTLGQLEETLTEFCGLYNQQGIIVAAEIAVANDERLGVVFPYDVDFDLFCFTINYLAYPGDEDLEPVVIGWGTFNGNNHINTQLADKNLMIFVPEGDNSYDVVSVVTEDNMAYMVNFAFPDKLKTFEQAEESYMPQPLDPTLKHQWERQRVVVPLQQAG